MPISRHNTVTARGNHAARLRSHHANLAENHPVVVQREFDRAMLAPNTIRLKSENHAPGVHHAHPDGTEYYVQPDGSWLRCFVYSNRVPFKVAHV